MTASTQPAARRPPGGLGMEAAARIRAMIAAGDLAPGAQLSEERFSEALGVSRNTLRESFRILARDRLVEHRFNRGVFIRTLTAGDVADVFAARRVIELAAVRRASPDAPGAVAAVAAVADARAAAMDEDWKAVGTADIRFHEALVSLLDNERLTTLAHALLAEMRLAFLRADDPPAFHGAYVERNAAIADAVVAGDSATAERLLSAYLDDAEQEMLAVTDEGRAGAGGSTSV